MNTELRCLLLDDELLGLTYLKMLCEQIPNLEIVKSFNHPMKLLEEIDSLDFDLCISDIEMPQMDGLSLAKLLQGKMVIFTTAYRDYAAEAFDIDAVDYITKPVTLERLEKAIAKVVSRQNKLEVSKKSILLNTDKGKALLFFDQILYIKTAQLDSRDKEVFLVDGNKRLLKNINFDFLMSHFPKENFCRINKKEIIAISAVKFFTHNEVSLKCLDETKTLPNLLLSETYRSDFLLKLKST